MTVVGKVGRASFAGAMLGLAFGVAGCNNTDTVSRTVTIGPNGTTALLTTADLRLVTDRPAPLDPSRRVVCAEPPPDVAKALSASAAASLAVTTQASVGGNVSGSVASAEQLSLLAGRVPALLALRDELFRACEAYANGIIGDASYALLLSRYGEILVTVVLADAAATAVPADAPKAAAAASTGATAPTPPVVPTSPAPKTNAAAWSASPGLLHLADAQIPLADSHPLLGKDVATPNDLNVTLKLPAGSSLSCAPPSPAAHVAALDCSLIAPTPGKRPDPAAPKAGTPVAGPKATATPATTTPATVTAATVTPAGAIAQMQQNYVGLSVVAPLMVACISNADPTRPHFNPRNQSLQDNCDLFMKTVIADVQKANDTANQVKLLVARSAASGAQRGK